MEESTFKFLNQSLSSNNLGASTKFVLDKVELLNLEKLNAIEFVFWLVFEQHVDIAISQDIKEQILEIHRKNWVLSIRCNMIREEIKRHFPRGIKYFGFQWWEERFIQDNSDTDAQIIRVLVEDEESIEKFNRMLMKQGFRQFFIKKTLFQKITSKVDFILFSRNEFVVVVFRNIPCIQEISSEINQQFKPRNLQNISKLQELFYRISIMEERISLGTNIENLVFPTVLLVHTMSADEIKELETVLSKLPRGFKLKNGLSILIELFPCIENKFSGNFIQKEIPGKKYFLDRTNASIIKQYFRKCPIDYSPYLKVLGV